MPYDSTKPADHSPIVAAELRAQFAGLNDSIQDRVLYADLYDGINANSAGPCAGFNYLNLTVSDPPTQAEVQAIANGFDNLLALLKRV